VFYLAAVHRSSSDLASDDPDLLRRSTDVHMLGWAHVLEAFSRRHPAGRAVYAASSHVFGEPTTITQDEQSPFAPVSVYGITKAAGVQLARMYRRNGLHVSCAVLYNHESPLRAARFASMQIVVGALDAAKAHREGRAFKMRVGSLQSATDWGWAPDYVRAMRLMVEHPSGNDYVVATGTARTIADFCRIAFEEVGLRYQDFVEEQPDMLTRVTPPLQGDASRLRRATGWCPSLSFEQMVKVLVQAERRRRGE
jgi:GDPmannose 4,6-dehydratase